MKNILQSLLFLLLLLTSNLFATTYYISPTGSNTADGSYATPWLTMNKALTTMSGGDTLILKDGTYSGTSNYISHLYQLPPVGSSTTWTTIKAEHDGQAIFDGVTGAAIIYLYYASTTSAFIQLEGLKVINGNVQFYSAWDVKVLRCIDVHSASGNTGSFGAGRRCGRILFEDCVAYGGGRTQFFSYQSSSTIMRNCISRIDRHDAWSGSHGEPIYNFGLYSTVDCDVQNSIAVDTDQYAQYLNISYWDGGIAIPSTDMDGDRNNVVNFIVLKSSIGSVNTTAKDFGQFASYNSTFVNSLFWDCHSPTSHSIRGVTDTFRNCTFGSLDTSAGAGSYILNSYDTYPASYLTTMVNCIFTNMTGRPALYDVEYEDYNSYYGNTTNFYLMPSSPRANDLTTVNPIWSVTNTTGALKNLVRIEAGSSLSGMGESGADIGANLTTLIGSTGTLWGEEGYNTDTGINMFPVRMEAYARHHMKDYSFTNSTGTVYGGRGFCAAAKGKDGYMLTLTKYIQEYQGNEMPKGTYLSTSTISSDVSSGYTGTTVTFTLGITSGTITQGYVDYGDGNSEVIYSTASTVSHTYNTAGSFIASWASDSSVGATNPEALDITITTAPEPAPILPADRFGAGNCIFQNIIVR